MRIASAFLIGFAFSAAVSLANKPAPNGTEIFARSDLVFAVIRVFETVRQEAHGDWSQAMKWAEEHTAVSAALIDTAKGKAVDVVILGKPTAFGGAMRFRVDLKTGMTTDLGPDR